jgi:hypothetical protein
MTFTTLIEITDFFVFEDLDNIPEKNLCPSFVFVIFRYVLNSISFLSVKMFQVFVTQILFSKIRNKIYLELS